jgi:hypothetical protein
MVQSVSHLPLMREALVTTKKKKKESIIRVGEEVFDMICVDNVF